MKNTQETLRYEKCKFCGGLVYVDWNTKDTSTEIHMCKDCPWTTIIDLPEIKHSSYTSNEFNEKLWNATKNVILYNELIDEVDAEIEADQESSCSNCDLHRTYRM